MRDSESVSESERFLLTRVDGYLDWFGRWLVFAEPNDADSVAKKFWPELNKRLLKVFCDAKGRAWSSIRTYGAPSGDESTLAKKRGRPQTIPDSVKAAALKAKVGGGSNRAAARILYQTSHPTAQQVKNVFSILRNYGNVKQIPPKPLTPTSNQ